MLTPRALRLVAAVVFFLGSTLPGVSQNSTPAPSNDDLRAEIEQLKQIVAAQQKRIDKLEGVNNATTPAQPSATPSQPAPTQAQALPSTATPSTTPVNAQLTAGSTDERIRNLERQIKGIGPISFSGDVRLRGETFLDGPDDHSLDRTRGRVRLRFNANADLGKQFSTGFSLATGDVNDPISTNQTLGNFYTRKSFSIDQAFVAYKPSSVPVLTLIGGKFRYPWVNTELVWDKDLNPEGAAEKLDFNFKSSPVLKGISLVGFQLPFAEVARSTSYDKSVVQSVMYGGQIQTRWQLGPHVLFSAYSAFYDFHAADAIALALAKASSKNPQTPLSGALPLQAGGNTIQNSIYTTTATNIITVDGTAYSTGASTISNAQFASKFGLFDNIARIDILTSDPKLPITFIGDFVQNTEACANVPHILAAPANTNSVTYKVSLNALCDSSERRGYWLEARLGRLQKKGDWQLGYTRIFIDREAVLSNFNYSDIRQGSNVTEHRVDSFYQWQNDIQLGFTTLLGRPIGILPSTGKTDPWLARLQFDVIYIF